MAHDLDVTQPDRFARLCAMIGYPDSQVVNTLVEEAGLSEADAQQIVEQAYQQFAEQEAGTASRAFESGDPASYFEQRP